MQETLNSLKDDLIKALVVSKNNDWASVIVEIDFPPFINRGFRASQIVKSRDGQNIPIALIDFNEGINHKIFSFIFRYNQDEKLNQIIFSMEKGDLESAKIAVVFNEEEDRKFWSLVPKSKRHKTIPWWKNPEEISRNNG